MQLIAHAQGSNAPSAALARISDGDAGGMRVVPSTGERVSAEPRTDAHNSAAAAAAAPRAHSTPPVMVAPGSTELPRPMRRAPSDTPSGGVSSHSTNATAAPRQSAAGGGTAAKAGGGMEWSENPEGWEAYSAIISQSEDMVSAPVVYLRNIQRTRVVGRKKDMVNAAVVSVVPCCRRCRGSLRSPWPHRDFSGWVNIAATTAAET
jgi:hypothetical protein